MRIINFSHPLTVEQRGQIELLTQQKIAEVIPVKSQIDPNSALEPQIEIMLQEVPLSAEEWQTKSLLINLPALNFSAAVMLAMLHGKLGYFPSILRIKSVEGVVPPRFEIAEIINLHDLRARVRAARDKIFEGG